MFQSRTHNCGELRLSDAGKVVTLAGWLENVREDGSEFQLFWSCGILLEPPVVVETEEMCRRSRHQQRVHRHVTGTVGTASKTPAPTGDH